MLSRYPNDNLLYFTKQNFTLLRETLLFYAILYYMKSIFSIKIESTKISFSIQELAIPCIFILIYVLEYPLNRKRHLYVIT